MQLDFLMKTTTKKIATLFFLLLGFTPLLMVLSFDIQRAVIQHRMKEKLEQQHLQKIVIPKNEVIWMDKHEIWINERMFDIHSSNLENEIYTFTGLYDEDETRLMKQRDETNEKNNEENKLLSQLLKWLQSTYRNNEDEAFIFPHYSKKFNSFITSSLIYLFGKVPTPPPRHSLFISFGIIK